MASTTESSKTVNLTILQVPLAYFEKWLLMRDGDIIMRLAPWEDADGIRREIPADAEVVSAVFNHTHQGFDVILSHPTFEVTPIGFPLPMFWLNGWKRSVVKLEDLCNCGEGDGEPCLPHKSTCPKYGE